MGIHTIETYSLDVSTGTFSLINIIDSYTSLNYVDKANRIGLATFTLDLYDEKGTANLNPFSTVVLIKEDGNARWVGVVNRVIGSAMGATGFIQVECYSYLARLNRRVTGLNYFDSDDAGTIASNLVALAEGKTNGDLGIQNGTIATVGNSQDSGDYKLIGDALTNLSDNIRGYDFEFKPILGSDNRLSYIQFNVILSRGSLRSDLPPLKAEQLESFEFKYKDTLYNKVTAQGFGSGDDIITKESENTSSQSTYGLSEAVIKFASVKNGDTLQDKADEFIALNASRHVDLKLNINPDSYYNYSTITLGDELELDITIPNTIVNFTTTGKVLAKEVNVDKNGGVYFLPMLDYVR